MPSRRRPAFEACAVRLAAMRAEPRDDAEQVTQVLAGEPLAVEERRDGWARVRTVYDYPGWLREDALWGDVLAEARRFLGAPYEWGGLSERGVDCSGLVHIAYRRAGRIVPRDAQEQEEAGSVVGEAGAAAGDLVTYGDDETADHVAFWLGEGRILHATGREGVRAVVEEAEPALLRARRRRFVRFRSSEEVDPPEED
jgi:cell wall-associated NlpC family hydrolase